MQSAVSRQRSMRRHHARGRWPALAPMYGVQFRSGHAVTFTEDDRAAAERMVAEAPFDRRLVVAHWRAS